MKRNKGAHGECAECGHLRLHHTADACHWSGRGKCQCSGMVVELTARELEILVMMGSGANSKDIARALNLSAKTVEAHRCNMAIKTDTHSAIELVLLALRSGVVRLGDLPTSGKIAK